jgi:hypothetical protein
MLSMLSMFAFFLLRDQCLSSFYGITIASLLIIVFLLLYDIINAYLPFTTLTMIQNKVTQLPTRKHPVTPTLEKQKSVIEY